MSLPLLLRRRQQSGRHMAELSKKAEALVLEQAPRRARVLEAGVVVSSLAISRTGDRLATAHGGNHVIHVYESATMKRIAR